MTFTILCVTHPQWEAIAHREAHDTDHDLADIGPQASFTPLYPLAAQSHSRNHEPTMSILTSRGSDPTTEPVVQIHQSPLDTLMANGVRA